MNSSYLSNVILIGRLNCLKELKRLRESVDRKMWEWILPTDINAYYRRSFNDISQINSFLLIHLFHLLMQLLLLLFFKHLSSTKIHQSNSAN